GNTSEKEKAEFFVAVINHKDDVIDKQYDKALWEWSSTDVEKITNEELDITLEGDDLEALSNHRVWLGWNLDDAQLKANREKISKLLRPNG
ncbi:MAG: hypothetical protein EBZ69_10280, partial [Alphaproteobacteria bacterium]|nr:hypothetical protein [Alphaproteobacteria bacterium]